MAIARWIKLLVFSDGGEVFVLMKKLIIVYNTNSSHHMAIENEVLAPLRKLSGWMVGKYAIKPTNYHDNVRSLSQMLDDGDLVIAAGGDGTASIAINSILLAKKNVVVGVLGFGNFNDIATTFGAKSVVEIVDKFMQSEVSNVYPLEIFIDGKFWRYAPCYATIGLLAQATTVMESPKVRKKLKFGQTGTFFSLVTAVKWYLGHHWRNFLPAGSLNRVMMPKKTTDYLAVNGPHLARIMKGEIWYQDARKFGSTTARLGSFWRMVSFGLKSIGSGMALQETTEDVLEFKQPSKITIHAEGEFEELDNVQKISISKSSRPLKIIMGDNVRS